MAISQKSKSVKLIKKEIGKGQVIQYAQPIPPFSTLTEKQGLLDINIHKSYRKKEVIISTDVEKPLIVTQKNVKISRIPKVAGINRKRNLRKISKMPRPTTPTRNFRETDDECLITNSRTVKKTNKFQNKKIDTKNKKNELNNKYPSKINLCDKTCIVINRYSRSVVELPMYNIKEDNEEKLKASTTTGLLKNFHQEKMAKYNEAIRQMNLKALSRIKPKEDDNKNVLKEKLAKLNDEIRVMNSKKLSQPATPHSALPNDREAIRKNVEKLNREIRLMNKNRIDAIRRSKYIRRIRNKYNKKHEVYTKCQKNRKIEKQSSSHKKDIKHGKNKSTSNQPVLKFNNQKLLRSKRQRKTNQQLKK